MDIKERAVRAMARSFIILSLFLPVLYVIISISGGTIDGRHLALFGLMLAGTVYLGKDK